MTMTNELNNMLVICEHHILKNLTQGKTSACVNWVV